MTTNFVVLFVYVFFLHSCLSVCMSLFTRIYLSVLSASLSVCLVCLSFLSRPASLPLRLARFCVPHMCSSMRSVWTWFSFFVSPSTRKQATTENTGPRTVEIQVELTGKGEGFLVVRDNGKGMNAADLKDFATYFLTQVCWLRVHEYHS